MDRLIVFDIGNVLLRFDTRIAARAFDRHDPGKGKAMARALWSHPLMDRYETGRIGTTALFAILRRRFKLTMSFVQFKAAFVDIFTPIPENIALFRRFSRTRRTALLSNVNELHWTYIRRRYPFLGLAHHPFRSYKIGVMKPHPRAFKRVAKDAGVALDRIVYVDDRGDFVRAAKALGITAIQFTGRRPLKDLFGKAGVR